MDETWVHHYTPDTKQQSKQCAEAGGSAPKKVKSIASARKDMASVFWDVKNILLIDYLGIRNNNRTIAGEYYSNFLDHLDVKICDKRKKINFHQNNAPAHKKCFGNEKTVKFERFASNEEVERAVDEYFNRLPDSHFWEGILILEKLRTKCVEVKEDYPPYQRNDAFSMHRAANCLAPRARLYGLASWGQPINPQASPRVHGQGTMASCLILVKELSKSDKHHTVRMCKPSQCHLTSQLTFDPAEVRTSSLDQIHFITSMTTAGVDVCSAMSDVMSSGLA
ncbi:hypothetical protein LAZ67_3003772 [Cordylochernes scorpioides]|uniref:Uncharacterized protein n=1 Tax=Cordylochernes scorpioides TaxID=51811 RepID=A0ABY6KA60_9ARAC|nr:hypothetical protein LAZ67_3003772 [Cordylochernes scorpioides]